VELTRQKNANNGREERENRADRKVAGAPTHSGELYRAHETHRARLSATECGRMRRSRWQSRRGGRRPELAGREAPSVSGDGARRSGCYGARAREREREHEQRGASGSGDGGGRGRALLVADQGASRLPHARHAAAELCRLATTARRGRPRADTARARGRRRARRREAWLASLAGPIGWRRPTSEQPPFPFFKLFFPKSLNEIFEAFAKLFTCWSKKKKCSPPNPLQLCFKM